MTLKDGSQSFKNGGTKTSGQNFVIAKKGKTALNKI